MIPELKLHSKPHPHDHEVRYYETDDTLASWVADFFEVSVGRGDPALIVASPEHLDLFVSALAARHVDTVSLEAEGKLVLADARATLASFLTVDGSVDRELFEREIGSLIDELSTIGPLKIFGEMVALLWEEGDRETAIALEDAWNELAVARSFDLLCAYPLHIFASPAPGGSFQDVQDRHSVAMSDELHQMIDRQAEVEMELARLRNLELVSHVVSREPPRPSLQLAEELQILLVEDNPFDAELIRRSITSANMSAAFTTIDDREMLPKLLRRKSFDLILTDYNLQGFDAITTLRIAGELAPATPVIIVTGQVGDEAAALCMKEGAVDYVLKDALPRLPQVVAAAVEQTRLRSATHQALSEMYASDRLKVAILDAALDCVIGMDSDGRIIEFNRSAEVTFGYERSEIMGRSVIDTIIPDRYREAHIAGFRRYKESGEARMLNRRVEIEALRSDGSEIPVELTIHEVTLPTETVFTAVIRDISERKEMETRLQASEARFRSLVQNSRDVVAVVDPSGTCTYISPAVQSLSGFTPDEVIGTSGFEFIHPEDHDLIATHLARIMTDPSLPTTAEVRTRTRTGEWIWIEIRAANHLDEPFIKGIVLNYHDITARKEMEKELRRSEELFRGAFDAARTGIALISADGRGYVDVNSALCLMLGYTKEELLALDWLQITHPDDRKRNLSEVEQFFAGHEDINLISKRYVKKSGEVIYVDIVDSLVRDDEGAPNYFVTHVTDVTERQRALEEREKLQGQLRQAQKMEAIGQLAGGIAHDFNNILAVIINYAQFVADDLDPDDERLGDVQQIISASGKAASLVHQLLAFSRKEVIEAKVVDLSEVVAGLRELLERSIGEDIQLEVESLRAMPPVMGDVGQLEQVIMNLTVNARDAMPRGGVISITTGVEEIGADQRPGLPAGAYATLQVRDSGEGIEPGIVERIFEPFFTTKQRGNGTGLGLATVYGIVKQAQGGIYVHSVPGEGTTFSVYLPVSTAPESEPRGHYDTQARRTNANGRVLVVEDEGAVRELVSRILIQNGFDVVTFGSGSEALAFHEENPDSIDLLLTDVVMPETSGKDLADALAKIQPNIKTLFMSGYTDQIIAARGVLEGGASLIQKPFMADELVSTVRAVLGDAAA